MATITIQAARTGFSPPQRVLNMSDQVFDDMIAAYQQDANIAVNGTATRGQVLNVILDQWRTAIREKIRQSKTVPAVIPDLPDIA